MTVKTRKPGVGKLSNTANNIQNKGGFHTTNFVTGTYIIMLSQQKFKPHQNCRIKKGIFTGLTYVTTIHIILLKNLIRVPVPTTLKQ